VLNIFDTIGILVIFASFIPIIAIYLELAKGKTRSWTKFWNWALIFAIACFINGIVLFFGELYNDLSLSLVIVAIIIMAIYWNEKRTGKI
jgi:small-conductance mechanosensitive channel